MSISDIILRHEKVSQHIDRLEAEFTNLRRHGWRKTLVSTLTEYRREVELLEQKRQGLEETNKRLQSEVSALQMEEHTLALQVESSTEKKSAENGDCKCTEKQVVTQNKKEGCKKRGPTATLRQQIPDEILENKDLQNAMKALPSNYNFEIDKTIWRLKTAEPSPKRIALQFPEGLLMYACIIADILERFKKKKKNLIMITLGLLDKFAEVECVIMGDVTYGACCIDDFTAKALGCDFLVHYGHSCLVPITVTSENARILYVFVDIGINVKHLCDTIKHNFNPNTKMILAGTIQFASAIHSAHSLLQQEKYFDETKGGGIDVPQCMPLSPGEVLGCTSPRIENTRSNNGSQKNSYDCLFFVADGRFHLESLMISNPNIPAYRYNPYDFKLTKEVYDIQLMTSLRKKGRHWGIILGTLGRQGNPNILKRLEEMLVAKHIPYIVILLSEIYFDKLQQFESTIDVFVQIGCPRLSIDWGAQFEKPLLNAYEACVSLEKVSWLDTYPMDYYRKDGGVWTNYYMTEEDKQKQNEKRRMQRSQRIQTKIFYFFKAVQNYCHNFPKFLKAMRKNETKKKNIWTIRNHPQEENDQKKKNNPSKKSHKEKEKQKIK
ncbi:dph2-like ovca [Reticulomyxa filosa]|uniref:2-(3-amino-3-carboxypropyl)histidine synthase subunit 1 n=1 Tax=Reticulomyxa filosa TaxID=46433 RepID=X6NPK2_RETFI|nr:dph2-like ovca [Reticulomyxa filosa]|eukprot:ETO27629.1 dph2-like ovca [Reticulomyxa filosa]